MNCPINEQTADGTRVGRCWSYLPDGKTCPRHGEVAEEVLYYEQEGFLTAENKMRERKGMLLWGREGESHENNQP